MTPTVQAPLIRGRSGLRVETELLVSQVRDAENAVSRYRVNVQTSGSAGYKVLWESVGMEINSRHDLTANVNGTRKDGVVWARYVLDGSFWRGGSGVGSQLGVTTVVVSRESDAGLDARLMVTGDSKLRVEVDGGGLGTIEWGGWIEVRSLVL